VSSECESGAGVHHRRPACVDRRDDLLGVDPLQVGAGGREMRVPELALDQRQRDPLMQQLNGVGMTQLMRINRRRTPASCATVRSSRRAALADQARPRVGPSITHNSAPTGSSARSASHGSSADHAHASIPTSRRLSFFPCLIRINPRRWSRSVSTSESASWIRSPARHKPRSARATDGRGGPHRLGA
jgi:hypothetical protein